jgi:hypothetical protein
MDLTNIVSPPHLVGKSLKPIIQKKSSFIRQNALTRWKNGYSLKTDRFRLTKWNMKGDFQYELYDHKYDNEELENLALNSTYKVVLDSLIKTIDTRIIEANLKPHGLGRQINNVQPITKAFNLTYGDLHDENGKIYFFKSKN